MPIIFFDIRELTLLTALLTDFPKYLELSLSLNSTASFIPVDAPEGTAALPIILPEKISTSTVGFPLESRICLHLMSVILLIKKT